jgi:putative sigma-54 modulation protein
METKITFRHLPHDAELRDYTKNAVAKIAKFLYRPVEAQVVFSKEKSRAIAEVNILADHNKFFARGEGDDFYLTLDQTLDKIETQVKKYHDRRRHTKGGKPREEPGESSITDLPEIIKSNEFFIRKPITVEEAIDCLDNAASPFLVFRRAENEKICVVYRRPDGNYGMIDPE